MGKHATPKRLTAAVVEWLTDILTLTAEQTLAGRHRARW